MSKCQRKSKQNARAGSGSRVTPVRVGERLFPQGRGAGKSARRAKSMPGFLKPNNRSTGHRESNTPPIETSSISVSLRSGLQSQKRLPAASKGEYTTRWRGKRTQKCVHRIAGARGRGVGTYEALCSSGTRTSVSHVPGHGNATGLVCERVGRNVPPALNVVSRRREKWKY